VRGKSRALACSIAMLGLIWSFGGRAAARRAQDSQELMPEESEAKGRHMLQQVIAALGGQAYVEVHDSDCSGRISRYGAVGDAPDFTGFRDLRLYPDKDLTEYTAQGEHTIVGFLMGSDGLLFTHGGATVTVFNGSEGWTLDKSGVADQPPDMIQSFREDVNTDMDIVLRTRLTERGLVARYAGPDIIDLKEADWIEFYDLAHHDLRLAIEKSTHLPLRWVITTRDPMTKRTSDITLSYVQYMMQDGVRTPLTIERSRNGNRVLQTRFTSCKYNTNPSPQLFTRASLEERAKEAGKKGHKDSNKNKN
jgi:hypothetical protein